jgi:hypothetical protein
MSSPTQRSLKYMRDQGYVAQVVERYNPYAKVRVDLFGFIDIVAIDTARNQLVGVQVTSQSNVSARIKKVQDLGTPYYWCKAGGRIEVHGWAKKGKAKTRKTWQITVTQLDNFPQIKV